MPLGGVRQYPLEPCLPPASTRSTFFLSILSAVAQRSLSGAADPPSAGTALASRRRSTPALPGLYRYRRSSKHNIGRRRKGGRRCAG
jgi:hypothetical protein